MVVDLAYWSSCQHHQSRVRSIVVVASFGTVVVAVIVGENLVGTPQIAAADGAAGDDGVVDVADVVDVVDNDAVADVADNDAVADAVGVAAEMAKLDCETEDCMAAVQNVRNGERVWEAPRATLLEGKIPGVQWLHWLPGAVKTGVVLNCPAEATRDSIWAARRRRPVGLIGATGEELTVNWLLGFENI
jgi:hypothetical protein